MMKLRIVMICLICTLLAVSVASGEAALPETAVALDKPIPLTGDGVPVLLWLGLALLSLAGIVELRRQLRKV